AAALAAAAFRLRLARQKFQKQFIEIFPDALDVIVRAVRAGLPVLDAIESTVDNVSEPVAGEFRRLLDELRIGIDLQQALERATMRIRATVSRFSPSPPVLQRRTGGSRPDPLPTPAGLTRPRKETRLKPRALTAESRATAYLLAVLPFVMMGVM